MAIDPLPRLEALRPVIKARWETLLGETPPSSRQSGAVIRPEMLGPMIDNTLARLMQKMRALPDRGSFPPMPVKHEKATPNCECGLKLLVNYYLSGVRALREILARDTQVDRRHVCRCLNLLAREEVFALASFCRFRGSATCGLRSEKDRAIRAVFNTS